MSSRHMGSVVEAQGLRSSIAHEIFPDRGSNPCPWHWQADSYPLYHQGSLVATFRDSRGLYLMLTPVPSFPAPSTLFYFIHGPSHCWKLSSFASFSVACHPYRAIWPKRGEPLSLLYPQFLASQRYTVSIQVILVGRQRRPERLYREAGPAPGETFSLKGSSLVLSWGACRPVKWDRCSSKPQEVCKWASRGHWGGMHVPNGASHFQGVKALHKVSVCTDACSVLHHRLELQRRLPGNPCQQ